jgi:Cdc6-like AAA superfamily ATPase
MLINEIEVSNKYTSDSAAKNASVTGVHRPYNVLNIYNPANQTRKELIHNFVVRNKEFTDIFRVIKNERMLSPPRHFIVQGQRGSGKTTLLLRLYYEVKGDESLKNWLLPVRFDEEQYNVRTLYKLWENIALYLEEELEEGFTGLYERMLKYIDERDYEKRCYDILQSGEENIFVWNKF